MAGQRHVVLALFTATVTHVLAFDAACAYGPIRQLARRTSSTFGPSARHAAMMTTVNFQPSGKSAEVEGGAKLSLAAYRAGVSIAFNCKMGTCATCEVKMNGRKVRTCVTNVPARGSVTVVTPR